MPAPISGFDSDSDVFIEPIVGIRGFRVTASPGKWPPLSLRGITMTHYRWGSGWNETQCFASLTIPGLSPEPFSDHSLKDCSCGFYAYHSYAEIPQSSQHFDAIGIIQGRGEVMLGDKGFRAQEAKIVALHHRMGKAIDELFQESYPDVLSYRRMSEMRKDFKFTYENEYYATGAHKRGM